MKGFFILYDTSEGQNRREMIAGSTWDFILVPDIYDELLRLEMSEGYSLVQCQGIWR